MMEFLTSNFDAMHVVIIHFPVGLLIVAPIFLVLSLWSKKNGRAYAFCALLLMILGTISTALSVATGKAASEIADWLKPKEAVMAEHERLSETTLVIFIILTAIFAAAYFLRPKFDAWIQKTLNKQMRLAVALLFLAAYVGGLVELGRAAHEGGRLVHEFKIRALFVVPGNQPEPAKVVETGG